jgi:hypothetical protein
VPRPNVGCESVVGEPVVEAHEGIVVAQQLGDPGSSALRKASLAAVDAGRGIASKAFVSAGASGMSWERAAFCSQPPSTSTDGISGRDARLAGACPG